MLAMRPSLVRAACSKRARRSRSTPRSCVASSRPTSSSARSSCARSSCAAWPLIATGLGEVLVIGSRFSAGTLRLREFLARNSEPVLVDRRRRRSARPGAARSLRRHRRRRARRDLPRRRRPAQSEQRRGRRMPRLVHGRRSRRACATRRRRRRPRRPRRRGLRGLRRARRARARRHAPGGQAGSSSKIENYLGFPDGHLGRSARRACVQRRRRSSAPTIAIARRAERLELRAPPLRVHIAGHGVVRARTVVIASGVHIASYRCANLAAFEGAGVYYAATHLESQVCASDEVVIVGGGNSAGQAAVFLARRRGTYTCWCAAKGSPRACRATSSAASRRPRHHAAHAHRGRGARGRRTTSSACAGACKRRARDARHPPSVPHDRRRAQHEVAAGLHRARRQRLRQDRPRARRRRARRLDVARRAARPTSSRPMAPASSPSATCDRTTSNASPPP